MRCSGRSRRKRWGFAAERSVVHTQPGVKSEEGQARVADSLGIGLITCVLYGAASWVSHTAQEFPGKGLQLSIWGAAFSIPLLWCATVLIGWAERRGPRRAQANAALLIALGLLLAIPFAFPFVNAD
jgi:hypothetical protein